MPLIPIKNLPRRLSKNGNSLQSWVIFLCTLCNKEVERCSGSDKKNRSCGCSQSEFISISNKGKKHTEEHNKKISEGNKGKIISEETKQKISIKNKGKLQGNKNPFYGKNYGRFGELNSMYGRYGELNPNWQGGKSFEMYPKEFKQKRNDILVRDNFSCQNPYCNIENPYRLDVHHIDYNKKNNNENNLITLCINCHLSTNSKYERIFYTEFYESLIEERLVV